MESKSKGIWQTPKELQFPVQAEEVLRKRQSLRRTLLLQPNLLESRVAILGGSTTQEVRSILEIFLLARGIRATFYESAYGAYYEEVTFDNPELLAFKPDVVLVHTTWHNLSGFPEVLESEAHVEERIRGEISRFERFWTKINDRLKCIVVQNNFDLPPLRPLANLDASEAYGRMSYILRMNAEFARYARTHSRLLINDIHFLCAEVGLDRWFDANYWYNYHMAVSPVGTVAISQNVASIVKSIYGGMKKCLVLDLDNTLWGGVIGDDGLQNLLLGRDHPVGEAYLGFQRYVKELQQRGVLLAVCSKNEPENAKEGLTHPDSVLKLSDFSAFRANWNPKSENIREIAQELNIALDSLVFVDDNPAERAIVSSQIPEVAVPEVGSDVTRFAEALEREGYFEPVRVVQDDLDRAGFYAGNAQRSASAPEFDNYGDFLMSLEMVAEIGPFLPVYLERITQLINKSNQFNLTTRRYTTAEINEVVQNASCITLYGRLRDRFGDNGLVSVVIATIAGDTATINVWLMSCRVLKREMEIAMFDSLVERCVARGVRKIIGVYIPSKKNGMVAQHYAGLGFSRVEGASEIRVEWVYPVPKSFVAKCMCIRKEREAVAAAAMITEMNIEGVKAEK